MRFGGVSQAIASSVDNRLKRRSPMLSASAMLNCERGSVTPNCRRCGYALLRKPMASTFLARPPLHGPESVALDAFVSFTWQDRLSIGVVVLSLAPFGRHDAGFGTMG